MWEDEDGIGTIWDHLKELRSTLITILFIVGVGFLLTLAFYDSIISTLKQPLSQQATLQKQTVTVERVVNTSQKTSSIVLPPNAAALDFNFGVKQLDNQEYQIEPGYSLTYQLVRPYPELLLLSPLEGVLLVFRVCFWMSLALTAPLWSFQLLKFVLPGLNATETRMIIPFVGLSFLFMGAGLLLAYYVTLPFSNHYLEVFNAGLGVNLWSLAHYIDYTLILFLGHAIAFELCLALLLMVHFQVLSVEWLQDKRRPMIVAAFILGALLTPPDVPTQLMLALPLIAIYELAILYGKMRRKTMKARNYLGTRA